MSELEEKLGSILRDPNMMQQIMGMVQTLSGGQSQQEHANEEPSQKPAPPLDPKMIKALSGIAQQQGTDSNQELLLKALQPYLSRNRIQKLERAMHAARMANAASAFLNAGGIRLLTAR